MTVESVIDPDMKNPYFEFRKSSQSKRSKRSSSYKIGKKRSPKFDFFFQNLLKWYWLCTFPLCKICALKSRSKNHLLTSLYVTFFSLTSFSFTVELVIYFSENGKRILFLFLLFTGICFTER